MRHPAPHRRTLNHLYAIKVNITFYHFFSKARLAVCRFRAFLRFAVRAFGIRRRERALGPFLQIKQLRGTGELQRSVLPGGGAAEAMYQRPA